MAQTPVHYRLQDNVRTVVLYPIRQGDAIEFDNWLKYQYVYSLNHQVELLPPSERQPFIEGILNEVERFDHQYGKGNEYLLASIDGLVRYIALLTRYQWQEPDIRAFFFPNDRISETALQIIDEMRLAVFRQIPPDPPQPNINRKRREYNEEEAVVRIYRSLGEKYHWTYQQCLELTPYQVFWYLYLLPEEREQIEELHRLSKQNSDTFDKPELPPGTIRFNSPEEYEAWRARQQKQPKPG